MNVAAGPAFAPKSFGHADALRRVRAGHVAALAIRLFDEYGNDTCDAGQIVPTLTCVKPGGLLAPRVRVVPPKPPGTAALAFTPSTVGELLLAVTINGQDLPGSPFEVSVSAGDGAAPRSKLSGEGLLGTVVRRGGLKRSLRLETADVFGNDCCTGGADVKVWLRLADEGGRVGVSAFGAPVESDDIYSFGESSPSPCGRGRASASGEGTASSAAIHGSPANLTPRRPPSAAGAASAGGSSRTPTGSRPPSAAGRLVGSVVDRGDGTYDIEYKALPGEWLLVVEIGRRAVPPTPCSVVNVVDPAEEEERRAREEAERLRQQAELEAELRRQQDLEMEEKARQEAEARRLVEEELLRQAKKEDEKARKLAAQAAKKEMQEEEKRRRIVAALRREKETKERAEAALKAVLDEKQRQLEEAERRKKSWSKRTGGGFVVNFRANDGTKVEEV